MRSWPRRSAIPRLPATLRTRLRCGGSTRSARRSGRWCASRCSRGPPMREEDVEAVRRGYEAWNRGDFDAALEMVDPEIEWRPGADAPEAGEHRGRDGFRGFLESWLESFEDLRIVPEALLVVGDCLVAMVRQRGRGRGS